MSADLVQLSAHVARRAAKTGGHAQAGGGCRYVRLSKVEAGNG